MRSAPAILFARSASAPSVPTTNTGTDNAAGTTSATVQLPSGIQSGDIVIVMGLLASGAGSSGFNWPAGWTQLYRADGLYACVTAAYRRCTGSEGSSIAVSWVNSVANNWRTLRLNNVHPTTNPESSMTEPGTSSTTTDPPSLTPSWGSDANLWIAHSARSAANAITAYPTNYTGNQFENQNSTCDHASATRSLTASSDDPGTFSYVAGNVKWSAATIAVRGV